MRIEANRPLATGLDLAEGSIGCGAPDAASRDGAKLLTAKRDPQYGRSPAITCGFGDIAILKAALEVAGAADRLRVADAIRAMNLTTGPAAACFPGAD